MFHGIAHNKLAPVMLNDVALTPGSAFFAWRPFVSSVGSLFAPQPHWNEFLSLSVDVDLKRSLGLECDTGRLRIGWSAKEFIPEEKFFMFVIVGGHESPSLRSKKSLILIKIWILRRQKEIWKYRHILSNLFDRTFIFTEVIEAFRLSNGRPWKSHNFTWKPVSAQFPHPLVASKWKSWDFVYTANTSYFCYAEMPVGRGFWRDCRWCKRPVH